MLDSTAFIGTADNTPLVFKTNNVRVGHVDTVMYSLVLIGVIQLPPVSGMWVLVNSALNEYYRRVEEI